MFRIMILHWVTLIAMLPQLDGRATPGVDSLPPAAEPGSLELVIVGPSDILADVRGYLHVELRNVSDRDVLVLPALDGSTRLYEVGREGRFPRIDVIVRDTSSRILEDRATTRDGFKNPLRAEQFKIVEPGGSLPFSVSWDKWGIEPGEYEFEVIYDSAPQTDDAFLGLWDRTPEDERVRVRSRLARVARTRVSAKTIVRAHAIDAEDLRHLMAESGRIGHVASRQIGEGRWRIENIRTFGGWVGFELKRTMSSEPIDERLRFFEGLWMLTGSASRTGARLPDPLRSGTFHVRDPRHTTGYVDDWEYAKDRPSRPLALEIVGPRDVIVGLRGEIGAQLRNVSEDPAIVLPTLDGSALERRYPTVRVRVNDETDRRFESLLRAWCGVMNPLHAEQFVELAPGETLPIRVPFARSGMTAGEYDLVMTYDSNPANDTEFYGSPTSRTDEDEQRIRDALQTVVRQRVSARARIRAHPVDSLDFESVVIRYASAADDIARQQFNEGDWRLENVRMGDGILGFDLVKPSGDVSSHDRYFAREGLWVLHSFRSRPPVEDPSKYEDLPLPLRGMKFYVEQPPRSERFRARLDAAAKNPPVEPPR